MAQSTRGHPRSYAVKGGHPRSPEVTRGHPRSPENAAKQVLEAIRGVHRLDHPCVLLPARAFLRMGSLREHEALRAEGQLLFYDSPRQLADKHVVFFSHQWLSFGTPDPLGVQYRVMAASLRRVIADTGWEEANVQVWVDLASIPQSKPLLKQLAVQTIACYCAAAHAFVICAPTTIHADTGEVCNVQSYQRRMWCRCEQLCHVLRKGTGTMWCATTEDDCRLQRRHLAATSPLPAPPLPPRPRRPHCRRRRPLSPQAPRRARQRVADVGAARV